MDRGGFLAAGEREALDRFPVEIDPEDVSRCFSLRPSDFSAVLDRRATAPGRLVGGLQLGALRLLGFVPADVSSAPVEVVDFVADQVGAAFENVGEYSVRSQTRSDHVAAIEKHLGYRRTGPSDLLVLDAWLTERALEHDRPTVLLRLACEYLQGQGLVRPGVTTVERAVIQARLRASEETYDLVGPQLDPVQRSALDGLLLVDSNIGTTPLVWSRRQAPTASPASIKEQLAKISLLRSVGAEKIDLEGLNPNRVRHLASVGKRLTPQAIARLNPHRRYQILAATVVDTLAERIDEVLDLFDLALATVDKSARLEREQTAHTNAVVSDATVRLFGQVARIVMDPAVPDDQVRATILARIGQDSFVEATDQAARIEQPDDGYLGLLCTRYGRTRQFTPGIIGALQFQTTDPRDGLLKAVTLLEELNATRARLVPPAAPVAFAPARWRRHMINGEGQIDRRAWEMCVLTELRGALRGANVWVTGSRRYQDPSNYLIPSDDWERLRPQSQPGTGVSLDASERLALLGKDLNKHLQSLDLALTHAKTVRLENDRLVVSPLPALETEPDLEQLRSLVRDLLPRIDLVDLLVEVDSWCGFLSRLTHTDNASERAPNHTSRLLASLVAHGCNFGLATMAHIAGFSSDELAWTSNMYLRTTTVREANDGVVDFQIHQPIAQQWGSGTLSSSDGQRFPATARNPRARRLRRYFTGTGATIYTWTSDRHAQYGTRIIPTTVREATFVLDAIFDNETTLEIEEHTTDTAGYTDLVFGLFDLTGLRFSPRIRGLADQRLWRLADTETKGPAAQLLRNPIRTERITSRWDDMLRVAATIRHGYLPASHLVSKLQGSARKNHLAQAIQEYGRIIKTNSILRYLHNDQHRRRIHNQLNKGESLHALRRQIFFANQGQIRRSQTDDQDLQGECLTLLTNAVICWNTVYTAAAIEHLRSRGQITDEHHIAHLSPANHEHINFHGRYDFSNPTAPPDGSLRKLRTI